MALEAAAKGKGTPLFSSIHKRKWNFSAVGGGGGNEENVHFGGMFAPLAGKVLKGLRYIPTSQGSTSEAAFLFGDHHTGNTLNKRVKTPQKLVSGW